MPRNERNGRKDTEQGLPRRDFFRKAGYLMGGMAAASLVNGSLGTAFAQADATPAEAAAGNRVVADPTAIPAPLGPGEPTTRDVTLEIIEKAAEIEPGVTFHYMTFGGQIPGPMIRVRQGDTVNVTLRHAEGVMPHNIDLHAVFGPGGGAEATFVTGGQENAFSFKAMYPGAFIYHCAVASVLDQHISSGMFGLIVVEPPEGLPSVDRELYFGQHEVYTDRAAGQKGNHNFDFDAMADEKPSYVLLNGGKYAISGERYGAASANVGETVRVFFGNGGPNLTSNFHPIGNVWSKAWREGAVLSNPERFVQTVAVPPGSALVAEMDMVVPGPVKLVDHALSRVARKGLLAVVDVAGAEQADIFDPDPSA